MEKHAWNRGLSLLLAAVLCFGCFSVMAGATDTQTAAPAEVLSEDGAAFGDWEATEAVSELVGAWTDDTIGADAVKRLLNGTALHPQKTGWNQLDALLEQMLSAGGSDTYSKLKYMYDWLVKNVTYSWEGYSYTAASVASYNSVTGYNYLGSMSHDGLKKTIPDDMANRTYHILTAKKGVCYDYAIAFAVIARYVGIDAYVHTGIFTFEDASNGAGHHGWSELVLGGSRYIFDPQRDARNYQYYGRNGYYFGIAGNKSYRYRGDTVNATRDASMVPVTYGVKATAVASRSGTVTGSGTHDLRSTVTLTASSAGGKKFLGWYNEKEALLSEEPTLSFTASSDRTVYAMFEGDKFYDLVEGVWYLDDVMAAANKGIVAGMTNLTFGAEQNFTRAQAVVMLARLDGADTSKSPASGFADCTQDWYKGAVNWAKEKGIVTGRTATAFDPEGTITRQEFFTMAVRYVANCKSQYLADTTALSYSDANQLESYAVEATQRAQTMKLIQGDAGTGLLRPQAKIRRSEGATILMRLVRYLEQAEAEAQKPTEPTEPETPSKPETPEPTGTPAAPETSAAPDNPAA